MCLECKMVDLLLVIGGDLSDHLLGVGLGPLSKILAVKRSNIVIQILLFEL